MQALAERNRSRFASSFASPASVLQRRARRSLKELDWQSHWPTTSAVISERLGIPTCPIPSAVPGRFSGRLQRSPGNFRSNWSSRSSRCTPERPCYRFPKDSAHNGAGVGACAIVTYSGESSQNLLERVAEDVFDEAIELRRQRAVRGGVLTQEEEVGAPLLGLLGRRLAPCVDGMLQVVHIPAARAGRRELGPVLRDRHRWWRRWR